MSGRFEIARADGRSNAQVLIDYVRDGEPGRIYSFDELAKTLSDGAPHGYSTKDVRSIVTAACPRMLREIQRTLFSIRGVGYRLSHGNDHGRLALMRTRRANVQVRRGVQILQGAQYGEMDQRTREVTEGMLLVMGGMYQQQCAMERRLSAVENAIKGLKTKA